MLRRWDPWGDLFGLRDEVERTFDRFFGETLPARHPRTWAPAVDVLEKDEDIIVRAELAGMKPEDVEITLTDESLVIRGEKKESEEVKGEDFYRRETSFGAFHRTIALPATVEKERIKAVFSDGVLEVRLPKSKEAAKAIKIDVEKE